MPRPGTAAGYLLVLILAPLLVGCWFGRVEPRAADWRPLPPPDSSGSLALQTVLLDRPVGDRYLTDTLWTELHKPLKHEAATLHARNGIRVGVVSGVIPREFDRLIHSDQATVNPMHRTTQPGATKIIPVNGPLDRCEFDVLAQLNGNVVSREVTGAECGLAIAAFPEEGGRVRLECALHLQHGDKQAFLKPTPDGTQFQREDRKPLDEFPTLAWTVTLGPGDFLVVGPTDDAAHTLGRAFFITGSEDQMRQRVLVVRAQQ